MPYSWFMNPRSAERSRAPGSRGYARTRRRAGRDASPWFLSSLSSVCLPLVIALSATSIVTGCDGGDPCADEDAASDPECVGEDPCQPSDSPTVRLGDGVGGAFLEYEDGAIVGLEAAPQGGLGVSVIIRTAGLAATGEKVTLREDIEVNGIVEGSFEDPEATLICQDDGLGGRTIGVVGFDGAKYKTTDDLVAFDGVEVELVVTVTDAEGNSATVRKPVVIDVGA